MIFSRLQRKSVAGEGVTLKFTLKKLTQQMGTLVSALSIIVGDMYVCSTLIPVGVCTHLFRHMHVCTCRTRKKKDLCIFHGKRNCTQT